MIIYIFVDAENNSAADNDFVGKASNFFCLSWFGDAETIQYEEERGQTEKGSPINGRSC